MSVPPCSYDDARIPCESCNRQFRSRTCFDKQKKNKIGKKTVCEKKRNCTTCNSFIGDKRHECFKAYCNICNQNREIGHFCFMQPLKTNCPAVMMYYLCSTILNYTGCEVFRDCKGAYSHISVCSALLFCL